MLIDRGTMGTSPGTSEIVAETVLSESKINENVTNHYKVELGQKYSIEDDINQLFEAIDIKTSRDTFRRSAMKRPMRLSSSSGIGISESVSLKQALRGLCISQASETAAMKRLSKPSRASGISEAGTIKRLYRAVVVDANESGPLPNEGNGDLLEISLVPESKTSNCSKIIPESNQVSRSADSSLEERKSTEITEVMLTESSVGKKLSVLDESVPPQWVAPSTEQKGKVHSTFLSTLNAYGKNIKSASCSSRAIKPVFRNKSSLENKAAHTSISSPGGSNELEGEVKKETKKKEKAYSPPSSANAGIEVSLVSSDCSVSKPGNTGNRPRNMVTKSGERSKEKGEISQSSKSSLGEYSSSTSFSEESNASGSTRGGYRPHMSKDLRWEAIHCVKKQHRTLGLRHFKVVRKLGDGDIGTVYLAKLTGTNCLFALKVMDNEFLSSRKKLPRAQTEKEILQMLDHPFLPTLFSHFTTERFSCLVMEYCPGGDLHVLRQKQPGKSFTEQAARFYVAEVLLALEYLHMLGVVYRDLKPENILVREDGHIMLSDFDLSLRCVVNPTLLTSSSPVESPKRSSSPCSESSCIDPFCLHPSWQVPCFTPGFLSAASKTRKLKSDLAAQVSPLPQVVVEPTNARSNSFVGTYEYLAPEIIKGEGHGSAVDWWTFGIFLYELLYGKTPFKGAANEDTLANVVSECLKFPQFPLVSSHARDLIRRLLTKEPENRLGSVKGAAEIKQHVFFEGLNWALIRCEAPPELPKSADFANGCLYNKEGGAKGQTELLNIGSDLEFEMF